MNLLKYQEFLLREIWTYPEPEIMINEGGAYGHLMHPFEDISLTMGDVKEMIEAAVNGAFGPENFVQEKCLSGDSIVSLKKKGPLTIRELVENNVNDEILSMNTKNQIVYTPITNWINNGQAQEWLIIETEDGHKIKVTPNHRIFLDGFDVEAKDLKIGDELIVI